MTVLVTAASEHGATGEIATAIADALRRHGLDVVVMPPDDVRSIEEFGAVVLGSAVYSGHWLKPATDLVERSAAALAARPVWLFPSGPVGDPARKLVQKMSSGRARSLAAGSPRCRPGPRCRRRSPEPRGPSAVVGVGGGTRVRRPPTPSS